MTEVLLKHKADPNRTDSEGFSSVHWAGVNIFLFLCLHCPACIEALDSSPTLSTK
jgi:ankyrin repeat protein